MENPESFVVGWGTLALINAGLAQGKNRSGLAWFLLSLLLGPMATFVLVAFCGKLEADVYEPTQEETTLMKGLDDEARQALRKAMD